MSESSGPVIVADESEGFSPDVNPFPLPLDAEMTHIAVALQRDSGNSIYERRDECRTLLAVAGPWAAVRRSEATQMNRSLRYAHF